MCLHPLGAERSLEDRAQAEAAQFCWWHKYSDFHRKLILSLLKDSLERPEAREANWRLLDHAVWRANVEAGVVRDVEAPKRRKSRKKKSSSRSRSSSSVFAPGIGQTRVPGSHRDGRGHN